MSRIRVSRLGEEELLDAMVVLCEVCHDLRHRADLFDSIKTLTVTVVPLSQ